MRAAVCLIVKDESDDILEWLAYHFALGFDTAIVYDNGSVDGTRSLLESASSVLDIRLVPWDRADIRSQMDAYEHACRTWKAEFDWIAFIDVDEFLVLHDDMPLAQFLLRPPGVAAIAINWAIFGSNGLDAKPQQLLIQAFTRRSERTWFPNRHVKTFVRPAALVSCLNPHYFEVGGDYASAAGGIVEWYFVEAGNYIERGLTKAEPDFSVAQVNHLFTRSKAHWRRKVARGYPADVAVRTLDEFDHYDRNEVEDGSAASLAPATLEIMQRVKLARQ